MSELSDWLAEVWRGAYSQGRDDEAACLPLARNPYDDTDTRCPTCGLTLGRHKPSCDQLPANPGLPRTVSTDIRCPHQFPTGQCLDHQGHLGRHQYPQETPA